MSLRSPLGRVLGTGSARAGTGHFWQQRLSAAALVVLGLWFALALPAVVAAGQGALRAWLAAPVNSTLLILLVAALAWHSSLGVQVVIEDYVHGPLAKLVSLVANRFAHVGAAAAAAFAILRIAFGAMA